MKKLAIIATTLGFLSPLFFSGTAQARSLTSERVCLQSGKYVVFAQHPVFFGAWNVQGLLNYWLPPEFRRTSSLYGSADITNTQFSHEHIFFCDSGEIVDNIGFGPEGRFKYSKNSLNSGKEPNGSNVDNFVPIDREKYDPDVVRLVVSDAPTILPDRCVLKPEDGKYKLIGNNCQNFTDKIRKEYWRKMFVGTWEARFPCGSGRYITRYYLRDNTLIQTVIQSGGANCLPNGHTSAIGSIPRNVSKGSAFNATIYLGTGSQTRTAQIRIIDANTFEYEGTVLSRVKQ
ncbi:MAG: hypothetical protein ACBR50_21475 [Microcoleus sp.]